MKVNMAKDNTEKAAIKKNGIGRAAAVTSVILLVVSVFLLFFANVHIPFMMDDLWYSTDLRDGSVLDSFSDIVGSQIWHYHNWGGRVFTHGFLQLSLMCGERIADVLNTVVTLVLVYEMYAIVRILTCDGKDQKKDIPGSAGIFALCFGLLISCCPNFKMSMLWQAGCANYVYSSLWVLLFYICYLRALDPSKKDIPFACTFIIPLGLITGWSTENMGPSSFLTALIITFICIKKKETKVSKRIWMICGSISSFIGSVMCILAPGNFIRKTDSTDDLALTLPERLIQMLKGAGSYLFPALLILAISYILYRNIIKEYPNAEMLLVLTGAVLSYGAMIMSPHYPDRAAFGTCILIEISAASMLVRSLKGSSGSGLDAVSCLLLTSSSMIMFAVLMQ